MRLKFVSLVLMFLLILVSPSRAQLSAHEKAALIDCTESNLGVKFRCNPKWPVYPMEHATIVVISSDPAVTLTFVKVNPQISLLAQVSRFFLEDYGIYEKGFVSNRVPFSGREAVKVKALSAKVEDARVLDYYFVNKAGLNGILFSVKPKSEWDNYKFLVKEIADSLAVVRD